LSTKRLNRVHDVLAGYIERLEADTDEGDEEDNDGEGSSALADLPPVELVAEV
jgi:hypothetical protein